MDRQEPYMPIAMVTDDTPVEIAPGVIVTLKEAIARRQPMTAPNPLREDEVVEVAKAIWSDREQHQHPRCRQSWEQGSDLARRFACDHARAAILRLDQVREGRGK